jgi:hypothetical protein
MPVGLGGLIAQGLGGDLNAQLAQALAGQQPNPQPGAGGAPSPSAAPGGSSAGPGASQQGQPIPPAQVYGPDPANASTIQLLLKVHQQDALSSDLNNRIAGISASFGTGQQQHDKMAALQQLGGIQDDRLGALGEIQKLQAGQQQLDQHNRFIAGADVMGQQLLGLKPGQGAWLAQSGQLPEIMQSHFRAMEPTEAIKNYDQARAEMQKLGMSNAEINQQMPPQMLLLGPNPDIGQRQYMQESITAAQAGKQMPDYPTWQAQHAAAGSAMTTQAKDVQEFKDTATQDYTNVKSKLDANRQVVDQLLANPDATMKALKYPEFLTTGKIGAISPVDQAVKDQAIAINKLRAGLTGESLSNVKNVRNQREFQTLGQAATAGLNAANSPEGLQSALQDIKNKFLDAQATAEMTVGHKLTGDLVGHGNRDLLNPSSPYYNGATEEAGGGKPLNEEDRAQAQALIKQDGRDAVIRHLKDNGYDTTGL